MTLEMPYHLPLIIIQAEVEDGVTLAGAGPVTAAAIVVSLIVHPEGHHADLEDDPTARPRHQALLTATATQRHTLFTVLPQYMYWNVLV